MLSQFPLTFFQTFLSDRLVIVANGLLKQVKLAYANKTKKLSNSQKLDSRAFGESLIVFSIKRKSVNLLCIMVLRCCLLRWTRQSCSLKSFLRTIILMTQLPAFFSRTNLKLHNIPINLKLVTNSITDLDFSKASGPDCISVVFLSNC